MEQPTSCFMVIVKLFSAATAKSFHREQMEGLNDFGLLQA